MAKLISLETPERIDWNYWFKDCLSWLL